MAKERKRGNREAKKPKGAAKKPDSASAGSPFQVPPKSPPTKGAAQTRRKSDE
jgi:hypothetical protein